MNIISNANVYLKEGKLVGKVEEITLPSLKMKMQEMKALGMYGTTEVPIGIELMEAKLKWNSIYPEHLSTFNPLRSTRLIVKSNMQVQEADGVSKNSVVTVCLAGTFKELPLGTIKPGEKQDGMETTMTINYYKLEVDGKLVQEIDIHNNVFTVGEVDVLKEFNTNQ